MTRAYDIEELKQRDAELADVQVDMERSLKEIRDERAEIAACLRIKYSSEDGSAVEYLGVTFRVIECAQQIRERRARPRDYDHG